MKLFILSLLLIDCAQAALSSKELKELGPDAFIYKSLDIADAPWPQVTIYTFIEGTTPKEAAAIFSSYEDQQLYVPDMLEAKIVKTVSPTDIHVKFVMDNPWPIANEEYTTGNMLSKMGENYRVSWYLVHSDALKDTRGNIDFVKHPKGTVFSYKTFVHPKSSLAFIASGFLENKISHSIKTITAHLGSLKTKNPERLKKYVKSMEEVLRNADADRL